MRETFVLSVVADAILVAATRNLGKRNDRKSLGEAGRVGEQLQNILLPWSSSPNTIQLITSQKEALPFSVDKRGVRGCNAFSHQLAVDRQEPEVLGRCRCGKNKYYNYVVADK